MSETLPLGLTLESQCWTIPSEGSRLELRLTERNNQAVYDAILRPNIQLPKVHLAPGSESLEAKDAKFYGRLELKLPNNTTVTLRAGLFSDSSAYPNGKIPQLHAAERPLKYTLLISPEGTGINDLRAALRPLCKNTRLGCAMSQGCEEGGTDGCCVRLTDMTLVEVGSIPTRWRTIVSMRATVAIPAGQEAPQGNAVLSVSPTEPSTFNAESCRKLLCGGLQGEAKKKCEGSNFGEWSFWSKQYLRRCEGSFKEGDKEALIQCLDQHMKNYYITKRTFKKEDLHEWEQDYLKPILTIFQDYLRVPDVRPRAGQRKMLRDNLDTVLEVYGKIVAKPPLQLNQVRSDRPELDTFMKVKQANSFLKKEKYTDLEAKPCESNGNKACIFYKPRTVEDPRDVVRGPPSLIAQQEASRRQRNLRKPNIQQNVDRGDTPAKAPEAGTTVHAGSEGKEGVDKIVARKMRRLQQERQLAELLLKDVPDAFQAFREYVRSYFELSLVERLEKLKESLKHQTATLKALVEDELNAITNYTQSEGQKLRTLMNFEDRPLDLLSQTETLLENMSELEAQPRFEDKRDLINRLSKIVDDIRKTQGRSGALQQLKEIAASTKTYLESLKGQREPQLEAVYVEYVPSALETVLKNLAQASAPTAIKKAWATLPEQERNIVLAADRWSTTDPSISSILRCLDAIWATEEGDFKLAK